MSLGAYLNDILNEVLLKDETRAPYTSDAQNICNKLMDDLKKSDSDFRTAFDGLSLTGKSFMLLFL